MLLEKYKTVQGYFDAEGIKAEKGKEYIKYCLKGVLWGHSDVNFISAEEHIEPVAFIEEYDKILQRRKVYFEYEDRKGKTKKVYCYEYYFNGFSELYFSQLP